jgi:hypothetical protein
MGLAQSSTQGCRRTVLTSFRLLLHGLLLLAGHCLLGSLSLQDRTAIPRAPRIERSLQGIAFPAKDVIAVLAISSAVQRLANALGTSDIAAVSYASPIE